VALCGWTLVAYLVVGWCGVGGAAGRVSARRPTYFSLLRQRKVGKRKAIPLSVFPSLRYGATCDARERGAAAELALLLRSAAQTTAASQITKRGHPSVSTRTPPAVLLSTARGVRGAKRAIAALGLGGDALLF
jgi:hypothetical protein